MKLSGRMNQETYMVCTDAIEKIWGGMRGEIFVVLPVLSGPSDMAGGAAVGEGSAYSLSLILNVLQQFYRHPQLSVRLCLDVEEKCDKAHLVLIGGPETNSVARKILGDHTVRDKLRYIFEGYKIVDKESGQCYEAKVKSDVTQDVPRIDYGIVWKGRNPFAEDKRVYIAAGSRTFGTFAASATLCDMHFVERFAEEFGTGDFEVIVERRNVGQRKKDVTQVISPPGLTAFPTIPIAQFQIPLRLLPRPVDSHEELPRLTAKDIIVSAALIFGGMLAVFLGAHKNMLDFSVPGLLAVFVGVWHILVQGR